VRPACAGQKRSSSGALLAMTCTQPRSNKATRQIPYAVAALLALAAGTARAGYNLTTLASFNGANGQYPRGLVVSGNTLYGVTVAGGSSNLGTVFSVPLTGGTPTVLASFNGPNGDQPNGPLIVSGNTLYGTTFTGGALSAGTVFSVPTSGGTVTDLVSFNSAFGGAAKPLGGLVLSGNTLYGTTEQAGAVFSLPVAGGTPTILASFNGSNGLYPVGPLIRSGNTLYGITSQGGAFDNSQSGTGCGTVFSVPITGGTITPLASFNGSDGLYPDDLILSGNTFYGTTQNGGNSVYGTVFSVPLAGGTPNVLTSFTFATGNNPGGILLLGNTLYGTVGAGTVFKLPITGGTPAVAVSFSAATGQYPGGLILAGNTLIGTTSNGGTSNDGTIFALTPNPIISLTATAPTAFGSQVGTLALFGGHNVASCTPTPTGYLSVSGFVPSTAIERYALHITDSVAANLAADLADAVSEINAASYSGYSLTAATTDPTGLFGSGYDFFLTFTGSTLGTGSPYFGFDFTQLNGISDTLSVDAVATVPEPASLASLTFGAIALLTRRSPSR